MYEVADLPAPRYILRQGGESFVPMETVLARAGFAVVAGADEAGRGACAGPLTAASCILPRGRRGEIDGLADSKLLSEATRERLYDVIVDRALAWRVVSIEADVIDRIGLHVANLQAMRRAVRALPIEPSYTLTDGFAVDGLGVPALAVWKGDRVSSSIAAASILAKVTRDRRMRTLATQYPAYGFDVHKGYSTSMHEAALAEHGPSPQHRLRYANVKRHRVVNSRGADVMEAGR